MSHATYITLVLVGVACALVTTASTNASAATDDYPVALWLVPTPNQQRQIQAVISDLAHTYSTNAARQLPIFQPHATLCTGCLATANLAEELRALNAQVDAFCSTQGPIALAVMNPPVARRTNVWSQFLFLALGTNNAPAEALDQERATNTFPAIRGLKRSLDADTNATDRVMPHVSLMYHKAGPATDANFTNLVSDVTNRFNLPRRIVFEAVQVVTPRSGKWEDIVQKPPQEWDVIYSRKLRPPPPSPLHMVISGGQTGVDQAALLAARAAGLLRGGWCPPDRVCETGRIPDSFPLQETPVERSPRAPEVARSQRTEWNVRDSDATLVLFRGTNAPSDAGTKWTIECADHLNRPCFKCSPKDDRKIGEVLDWLRTNSVKTLNVAGPSEGTQTGIGATAQDFLLRLFTEARRTQENSEPDPAPGR